MGTGADEEEELLLEVGTEAVEVEVLPSAMKIIIIITMRTPRARAERDRSR